MPRPAERMPRYLHAGLLLAAILTPLGSTMIAVALPQIGRELGVGTVQLNTWLVMTYLVVAIAGQVLGGALGDRVGHERALVAGVGLHALGAVLGSLGVGLPALAVARMTMAAGGAVTLPAAMALLRNRLPAERRPRAFGLLGGALGLAAAVGPPAGGALVAAYGWRGIFACNLPLVALAALLGARPAWNSPPLRPIARRSRRLDMRFLRRREFAAGGALVALQNLAMYGLLFLIPVALSASARDVKPDRLLFGMLAGMAVASPIGGRLAERVGARAAVLLASSAAVAGFALIHDLGPGIDPARALVGLVLLGVGLGLSSAPAQAAAMSSVPSGEAGAAAGLLSTMRYIGGLAGIALLDGRSGSAAPHAAFLAALVAATLLGLALPGRRSARTGPGVIEETAQLAADGVRPAPVHS